MVEADSSQRRWRSVGWAPRWWIWICGLALAEWVVIVILRGGPGQILVGDAVEYHRLGYNLVHHAAYSASVHFPFYTDVVRTPGYPLLVAAVELAGGSRALLGSIQLALLAATAILVGLIGRRYIGRVEGTAAAALCATYLPLVWMSQHYWTEVLATFLLTLTVWLLIEARGTGRVRGFAAAGATLALLVYVRPEYALLAIPVGLVLLVSRGWRPALAFAGVAVALVLPWTVRNVVVTGHVVPIAASQGSDMLASADQYKGIVSYQLTLADWLRYDRQAARIFPPIDNATPVEQVRADDAFRSAGWRIFRSVPVARMLGQLPRREAALWGPGDYSPPGWGGLPHPLAVLQYALLLVLGAGGVVIRRRRLAADWPLWITGLYIAVLHIASHVEPRYSVPSRAPLLMYPAVGLAYAVGLMRVRAVRPMENPAGVAVEGPGHRGAQAGRRTKPDGGWTAG